LQKKVTLINTELKTKQALLKRVTDKNGNVYELEVLVNKLDAKDAKLKELEEALKVSE
jgi:hypothetical protein